MSQWQAPSSTPTSELRPPEQTGGIGAWNDFSATANVARESLLEAAGVEVPDTSFVVIALVLYLVALVPLNWLVFNAIGRVEWAWIAAPIIALAGTWVIVDRARLDIGFVRAQTEIGVLELQPDYDRGPPVALHGALHVALDDVRPGVRQPDDGGGAVSDQREPERAPAAAAARVRLTSGTTPCGSRACSCRRTRRTWSTANRCSRSTGRFDLGRSKSQGRLQIENRSKYLLKSVALVERTSREQEAGGAKPGLRGIWIGELRPGESMPAIVSPPIVLDEGRSRRLQTSGRRKNGCRTCRGSISKRCSGWRST